MSVCVKRVASLQAVRREFGAERGLMRSCSQALRELHLAPGAAPAGKLLSTCKILINYIINNL